MKKILALTLALVMCVATFSACSSDEKIQSDIASSNNNKAEITSGVLEKECSSLVSNYFKKKRIKTSK